jgi:hypothetical protein
VQYKYLISQANVRDAAQGGPFAFAPLFSQKGALNFAMEFNEGRTVSVKRSAELLPAILSNFGQAPLAILKGGELAGYLVANDKLDVISEIAAEAQGDLPLILKSYLARHGLERVEVKAPEYDRALNLELCGIAECMSVEAPEKFIIFNFTKVLEAYLTLKHSVSALSYGEFSAVIDGRPLFARIDCKGVLVEPTASRNAPRLKRQEGQMLVLTNYGKWSSICAPQDWFPLPLFWHAADLF